MKLYLKQFIINFLCFFAAWIVLDLIFSDNIDWREALVYALVFSIVVVPVSNYIMKKFKMN